MEWKSIIILCVAVCVAVQTVFASIDLFLLRRYKSSLHTHLVRFWVWLDDVHIREIYRVVAALASIHQKRMIGTRKIQLFTHQ